ncbi:hypothetical protein SK128_006587 [Halocaridina rubra]|uniref:Uncharacterized protein n=1 Tax=Halocaridina rubra TaxID=373956 RepID=A0AAN8XGM7_HALRR
MFIFHESHKIHSTENNSSWHGKQKVVRILHQVCSRGHCGVRIYLRGRDEELRKAASTGGPPDPVLANTPQLFLTSAIQELLTLLFDPKIMRDDDLYLAGNSAIECSSSTLEQSGIGQGYGSSEPKGKYEGFGSSPLKRSDNFASQVRDIVERVISPSDGGTKRDSSLEFLQGEKGDYQPLSLPSLGSSVSGTIQPAYQPHLPILTKSQSSKYRAHKIGRAGGGWDSDEEKTESPCSPSTSEMEGSLESCDHPLTGDQPTGPSVDDFLMNFLHPKNTWPLDHDQLKKTCQECTAYNLDVLLETISSKILELIERKGLEGSLGISNGDRNSEELRLSQSESKKEVLPSQISFVTSRLLCLLLLVEFGLYYDTFAPNLINNILREMLQKLQVHENIDSVVKIKAKKLLLILAKLL